MSNIGTYKFKTEMQKILNILVHSLYTNKDIFLRELLSNAADALDKINYILITQSQNKEEIKNPDLPLEIKISIDKDNKKLYISDTGIGMTKEELQQNLGTIAHSGSKEFLQRLSEHKNNLEIIGQFGVGFYSVFMVAKEVRVHTKSYKKKSPSYTWISTGEEGYKIKESDFQKQRGTTIEILLKDDEEEYLNKEKIKEIIYKYSNFINFPIYLDGEKVNKISALWTKNKSEIKEDEYIEFYKFISKNQDTPLTYLHLKFDSPLQFSAILYVGETNLEKLGFLKYEHGLHLYSKKILIQPDNKELLPPYLRFIYGVVDSEDIDLNVSRELIQNTPVFSKIKSNLTKKLLDHFNKLAKNDKETYTKIWNEFGRFFKEAIHLDLSHRDKIVPLLRFISSKSKDDKELISLDDYIKRMQVDQKEIYYITGPDLSSIKNSPYLEFFKKEDIEVLFLTDPLDEFVFNYLIEYKDKKFKSVENADIESLKKTTEKELTEKEKEEKQKNEEKIDKLINFIKLTLKDKIVDVVKSKRLVDSPVCLVNAENAPSAHIQKLLKMMTNESLKTKKILEINTENPIIQNLAIAYEKNPVAEELKDIIEQLYENSIIAVDGISENPDKMIKRIEKILSLTTKLLTK